MAYDYIDYNNPDSYNYDRNDPLTRGKKKIQSQNILTSRHDKTYLVHLLPSASSYVKGGKNLTLNYHVSTLGPTNLNVLFSRNEFEGNLGLERSLYNLISDIENGGGSERRVLAYGNQNSYSGYIQSIEQHGKMITIIVQVTRINPDVSDQYKHAPKTVVLESFDKSHDLGFNLKRERSIDNAVIQDLFPKKRINTTVVKKYPKLTHSTSNKNNGILTGKIFSVGRYKNVVKTTKQSNQQHNKTTVKKITVIDPSEEVSLHGTKNKIKQSMVELNLPNINSSSIVHRLSLKHIYWTDNSSIDWKLMYMLSRGAQLNVYRQGDDWKAYTYLKNAVNDNVVLAMYRIKDVRQNS